jgi:hypothetical protein
MADDGANERVSSDSMGRRAAGYGLRNALDRYMTTLDAQLLEGVYASAAEAVWWACALDEAHRKADGQQYEDYRDADLDGQTLHGLRFARNHATHRLVSLQKWDHSGITFPATLSARFFRVTWLPRTSLPPLDQRSERQETTYDARLAGEAVEDTLRAAVRFLKVDAVPYDPRLERFRLPGGPAEDA